MKLALLSIIAAITFCGCAAQVHIRSEGLVSYALPYAKMTELLEKQSGVSDISIPTFQRDATGSKLFISYSFRQGDEETYRTAIVTSESITIEPGFPNVVYDDSAQPIFWLEGYKEHYNNDGGIVRQYDGANYIFKAGPVIPYGTFFGFREVLGGDFILVKLRKKNVWSVSALSNPTQEIFELPPELEHPECAIFENGELTVLGRSRLPHGDYGVDCLIYRHSSSGYRLSEEIPLPWANSAYDLDPRSGNVLLTGNAQMFAGYYKFNLKTKHRSRLGFAPADNVLFLNVAVIHTLNAAINAAR